MNYGAVVSTIGSQPRCPEFESQADEDKTGLSS